MPQIEAFRESLEKRNAVQAYRVTAQCKACAGDLEFTGEVLSTFPPRYIHVCQDRYSYEHEVENEPLVHHLDQVYPAIEYQDL